LNGWNIQIMDEKPHMDEKTNNEKLKLKIKTL
jgi:hypothetical protein